mmetsp:Transcript_26317/g.49652  ORF Transcript_26317/g.49652 Transcript_26317/m.49652 type:complete len:256 (+) Transcript_26317:51-818(+)
MKVDLPPTWADVHLVSSSSHFFVAIRQKACILHSLGWAPASASEVLLASWVLFVFPIIAVVSVADADLVRWACFYAVRRRGVLLAGAIRAGVIPEDQIQPLARRDVISPVTLATEMAHARALDVLVGVGVFTVVGHPHEPTELQPCTIKVKTQTDVESDVRIVCVHIEAEVFTLTIPHDEAVMPIPNISCTWKKQLAKGLEKALQPVDERLHSDVIQDDAVVVHAVRPPRRKTAGIKIEDLFYKSLAEGIREHFE